MVKRLALVAIGFASLCGTAMAQDSKTVIANAQKALGDPTSITYSGSAKDVAFQQCGTNAADMICRGTHDPMRPINNYVRVIDLAAPASRHTGATNNPAGGGATTPIPGTFFQQVTPQQADVSQPWATSVEFYLTPWGFLKGAAANNATASRRRVDGKNYTVLTWSPAVKAPSGKAYVINGYVNEQQPRRARRDVAGRQHHGRHADRRHLHRLEGFRRRRWRLRRSCRRAAAGRSSKSTSRRRRPIHPMSPRWRLHLRRRPAVVAPAGGRRRGWRGPRRSARRSTVTSEKLGDGLYRLTTGPGSYDSLIVEFRDHIMMLEAGQSEARGLAYIAEAKKLIPNKPIRYVMNTHPHSDHTGGLPALVAEGATIITQQNNEAFFEKALNTPRTLLNDTLAKNPKKAKVEAVAEKKVYSDGTRTVEMYHVSPVPHSNGLMIAYIPKEKILFQGDFSLPAAGQPGNDHVKALVPILEKLNLDFDRYINVHASATPQTKAELWKAVGK